MSKEDEKQTGVITTRRKIGYYFAWAAIWPLLMGVFAVAVLFFMSLLLSSWMTEAETGPEGYQIRLYIALFTSLMALIALAFIIGAKRAKSRFKKYSAPVLRVYAWLGILLGVSIIVMIPDPQTSASNAGIEVQQAGLAVVPNLTSDQTIMNTLSRVGASDTENIETKFVNGYEKYPDRHGEYQSYVDVSGKWVYGVLTVKKGVSGSELNTVVAHEYLHHIWFKKLDEKTKYRLTSDLISAYGNDPAMRDRVKSYSDDGILQPTELFSFYCTESSDGYLTEYTLAQCNKYINRSVLTLYR